MRISVGCMYLVKRSDVWVPVADWTLPILVLKMRRGFAGNVYDVLVGDRLVERLGLVARDLIEVEL